jgi:hypothetical protein
MMFLSNQYCLRQWAQVVKFQARDESAASKTWTRPGINAKNKKPKLIQLNNPWCRIRDSDF